MKKVTSYIPDNTFVSQARVVFSPIQYTKTVSIGILLGVGSITEETEVQMGYSHFLEHMIFKGTYKMDFEKINKEFEKMGAYVNAFTGKYYTLYYLHALEEFAEPCLNLLLEMVFESTLPTQEILKEQKVVIEEIHSCKDIPEDFLQEEFYTHTFAKSFFGTPILGTEKTVQAITQDSLYNYYKQHYTPDNCLISVAGNFKEEKINMLVENFFKRNTSSPQLFQVKKSINFYAGQRLHYKAELEQSHICLGINTHNLGISKYILKLFNTILGGMSSSRLYLGIREKKALCYNIDSSIYTDPNTGFINIFASTQTHRLQELLDAIFYELNSFKKLPVSDEELLIAKNQLKSRVAFRQESVSQTMMKAAAQIFFYGKIVSDEWALAKLDNITLKDFNTIYEKVNIDNISLHTLIPAEQKKIKLNIY